MAKDAKPRKTTVYVVLTAKDAAWVEVGVHAAVNAEAAMRAAAHGTSAHAALGESFVAVPARSWKPMQRTVEQVTKETWT